MRITRVGMAATCVTVCVALIPVGIARSNLFTIIAGAVGIITGVRYLMLTTFGPDMSRRDRVAWQNARSIADLAHLTGMWLRGEIQSQPGYYGPVDVDEEPGLLDCLLALNDAGIVTDGSQEGYDGHDDDDIRWRQCAFVTGFASPSGLHRLSRIAERHGLRLHTGHAGHWTRYSDGWAVTWRDGQPITDVSAIRSRHALAQSHSVLSGAGLAALQDAWQYALVDPEIGRNDMWQWIRDEIHAEVTL